MKEKETNYAPSYEELETLEICLSIMETLSVESKRFYTKDAFTWRSIKEFKKVIKSLHHKHMNYELRNVKLNKTK